MFSTWRRKLVKAKVHATARSRRPSVRGQTSRRLELEVLEHRLVPATHTWSGLGTTDHWSDPANWSVGGAPSSSEMNVVLNFPAGAARLTNHNDLALTVASISFADDYYVVDGGGSTTLTGSITASGAHTVYLELFPVTLGGNVVLDVALGTLNLMGKISGAFGLSLPLTNNGRVTLYGDDRNGQHVGNTYAGGTTIANGRLLLYTATAAYDDLGSGSVSLNGGELEFMNGPATSSNPINVGGDATIDGTSGRTVTLAGSINLAAGKTLSIGGGIAISGLVSGAGSLSVDGDVSLQRANTYTGRTVINGSIDITGVTDAVPSASAVIMGPRATLFLNGWSDSVGSLAGAAGSIVYLGNMGDTNSLTIGMDNTDTTFSGRFFGYATENITKTGTGTLTLSRGNGNFIGTITLNSGGLAVGSDTALGSGSVALNGGTLQATTDVTLANSFTVMTPFTIGGRHNLTFSAAVTLSGSNTLTVNNTAGTVTFDTALSGSIGIAKTGSGALTLPVANSYTGPTTLQGGILTIGTAAALGPGALTLAGGTLQASTLLVLARNFALTGSAGFGGTNELDLTGNLTGAGSLIKSGTATLVLSGTNTYAGATTVAGGTLRLPDSSSSLPSGTAVTVAGGATLLDLNSSSVVLGSLAGAGNLTLGGASLTTGSDNTSTTFSGTISGASSVTKLGTGTWTVLGANTYSGSTTLMAGSLAVGSAALGTGTLVLNSGTLLQSGTTATLANPFTVNGTATIGGSNDLTLSGPGTLSGGSSLTIANTAGTIRLSGGLSGTGGLTKMNAGTLVLPAADSYTAGTTLTAGVLIVGNAASLSTGQLMLQGGVLQSSTAVTLANTLTVAGPAAIGGSNDLTLSAAITVSSSNVLTSNNTAGIITLSAGVGGPGALAKAGAGTLSLPVANTYGGGTTLTSGTLLVGNNNALGSGTLTLNGGILQPNGTVALANSFLVGNGSNATVRGTTNLSFSGTGTLALGSTLTITNNATTTFSAAIDGGGVLIETAGTGTLVLPVANTYGGGTTLTSGTLIAGNNNALGGGMLTLNGGTLQANTSIALNNRFTVGNATNVTIGGSNNLNFGGIGTLDNNSTLNILNTATTTFAAAVGGAGRFVETAGVGTLVLSVANTYSGGTTLNLGTLTVGSSNALGTGRLTLAGGTLQVSTAVMLPNDVLITVPAMIGGSNNLTLGGQVALNADLTVSNTAGTIELQGPVTGSGGLTKNNAGALVLSHASNSYAGLTTVNGGTLQEAKSFAIQNGNDLVVAAGATFDHETTNHQPVAVYLDKLQGSGLVSGSGTVDIGVLGGDSSFSGKITGTVSLVKDGAGQFTLAGNTNDYSGGTSVFNGALLLGHSGALPGNTDLFVDTSATFNLNSFSATTRSLAGSGTVMLGSGTLTTGTLPSTYGGRLTGTNGHLMKVGPGTLTLTNDGLTTNDYSGGTSVVSGTLRIGGDNRLPSAGAVAVQSGATLDFNAGTTNFLAGSSATVTGNVLVSGGTVNFSSGTQIMLPTLTLSAGRLLGSDTVTVTNQMTWTGGTMAGAGMTMIGRGGQMTVDGPDTKMAQDRPVCNGGTTIWDGSGGIWLGGGSYFDNEPGATFRTQSDAALIATDATTPTFLNEGTFIKAAGSSMAATTIGSGQFLLKFHNDGTLNLATGTMVFAGNSLDNFDPIGGTLTGGTYIVVGTLQLAGASNFVTNAATLVLDGTGPGQILDENGNNGLADLANIAPGGMLTLQNAYVLTTGGDLLNFGYLLVDATSQLTVSGNYTQDAAATLEIQLDGIGGTAGQLNVAGTATLDGTLVLTPVNGYVPSTGDSFAILTYGARSGDFANPPAGFNESFDDGNGVLTVMAQ